MDPRADDQASREASPWSARSGRLRASSARFQRGASYLERLDRAPGDGAAAVGPPAGAPGLDFTCSDPLGLSSWPRLARALARAAEGSAVDDAERALAEPLGAWLGMPRVSLFASGAAARQHAIQAQLDPRDFAILDRDCDGALACAAHAATPHVVRHAHLDLDELRAQLCEMRSRSAAAGILVVTQSLFPLESDAPNLVGLARLCRAYDARLLVDASCDLGLSGADGSGHLAALRGVDAVDVVVGSLGAALLARVGFVASGPRALRAAAARAGAPRPAGAPSTAECGIAAAALEAARSRAAGFARRRIAAGAVRLRQALERRGVACPGDPSPFVPVPLGWERGARRTHALLAERGLRAELVDYPLAPAGGARLCLRVSAACVPAAAERVGELVVAALQDVPSRRARA